ncbi:MAG TPA: DUF4384 domain-containing protein [Pyrinomonadaceae bacterium]
MRLRTPLLTLAVFALAVCGAARAQERQKDQQVIDDFTATRGVSFDEPGKQTGKRAKPAPRRGNAAKGKAAGGGAASGKTPAVKAGAAAKSNKGDGARPAGGPEAATPSAANGEAAAQPSKAGGSRRPLALGFTMFMKDDDDRLTFVEPTREFKTGDRIAIAFETNADGYLYMFNASGGSKTLDMVFPDALVEDGANALRAHTYVTFPSDVNQGIEFTDPPATEHLFVVFSREPLAGVPAGEALAEFCRGKGEACTWRLSAEAWGRIRNGVKGRRVTEAKNARLTQAAPPPDMPATLQRGLKVKTSAPKPAFVRVSDSPDADILITEIVLTHK